MSELENDIIDLLVKRGVVNEHSLRDYQIRKRYKELRAKGMKSKEARLKLAEEFRTGEKNIEDILYVRKKEE